MRTPPAADDPTDRATGVAPRPKLTAPPDLVGQTIVDSYRIERRVGSGGMGVVYEATHLETDRTVALKCIHPSLTADASATRRFLQEIRAVSKIRHDSVVEIYDSGETLAGAPFVVMEFLAGEDLSVLVQREGPLPWRRVAHILVQVADALAAAHRLGIVHRDIKPANCLRTARAGDDDCIKVLDFGLARLLPELNPQDESMTSTGVILGTPGYIAPEVYRGLRADPRSDIYALGVMAYRLLKDELPPFKIPEDGLDKVPSPLQIVIRKCLSHDPDDRYPRADLVRDAVRAVLGVPTEGPTVAAVPGKSRRASRFRSRAGKLALGVAGLLIMALSGTMLWTIDLSVEKVTPPDLARIDHATVLLDVNPPEARVHLSDEMERGTVEAFVLSNGRTHTHPVEGIGLDRIANSVEPGYHTIITQVGLVQQFQVVHVKGRQLNKVAVNAESTRPLPGSAELKIGSAPGRPPATVWVGGYKLPKPTPVTFWVRPGRHTITWKYPDGKSETRRVLAVEGAQVIKGSSSGEHESQQPIHDGAKPTATLHIKSIFGQPPAVVWVDENVLSSETPVSAEVRIGTHALKWRYPDGRLVELDILALAGAQVVPGTAIGKDERKRAVAEIGEKLAECRRFATAAAGVKVDVSVDREGRVVDARAERPAKGTDLGGCIENAVRGARFHAIPAAENITLEIQL